MLRIVTAAAMVVMVVFVVVVVVMIVMMVFGFVTFTHIKVIPCRVRGVFFQTGD